MRWSKKEERIVLQHHSPEKEGSFPPEIFPVNEAPTLMVMSLPSIRKVLLLSIRLEVCKRILTWFDHDRRGPQIIVPVMLSMIMSIFRRGRIPIASWWMWRVGMVLVIPVVVVMPWLMTVLIVT